jgi:chromosome partitioning protein
MKKLVVSVLNQKGGVGKTTVVTNLAHGLSKRGLRTLVIDIDPQANLSTYLLGKGQQESGIESCLIDRKSLSTVICNTGRDNLDIVTTGMTLARVKSSLEGDRIGGHEALRDCLKSALPDYDVVLIDNPADFDLLTLNSLMASTHYLIPVVPEYLPMQGVKLILDTVEKVSASLKKEPIDLVGCVPSMVDMRLAITKEAFSVLEKTFPEKVLPSIRINTRLKEAPAHSETVYEYEDKRGMEDFEVLVNDFIRRMELL